MPDLGRILTFEEKRRLEAVLVGGSWLVGLR